MFQEPPYKLLEASLLVELILAKRVTALQSDTLQKGRLSM